MVCQSQEDKFDESACPRQFPINFPVPHPFHEEEGYTAADGEENIENRRTRNCVKKIGCQKDGRSDLMYGPQENGELEYPEGTVAYFPLAIFFTLFPLCFVEHFHRTQWMLSRLPNVGSLQYFHSL